MNCQEVIKQLTAYLDEEVSASEKKSIHAHLSTCKRCQRELEFLGRVKDDLRQHLKSRAATAAPSPQAWAKLHASLPSTPPGQSALGKTVRSISFPGKLWVGEFSIQRIGIILMVLVALVAVAPPVWARIQPIITNWFSFSSPDRESQAAIGGFTAFVPYHATFLPEGFQQSILGSSTSVEPQIDSLEIGYDAQEKFIILLQSKGTSITGLPTGEPSLVGTIPAIFIPSFATSQEDLIHSRPWISTATNYSYTDTNLLTWFMGEIKIELFSNLPLEELLKVATSLEPMLASVGETPEL